MLVLNEWQLAGNDLLHRRGTFNALANQGGNNFGRRVL
jgi:hypothetical protein